METRTEECTCSTCSKPFEGKVDVYLFADPPREFRDRECPECAAAREADERRQEAEEMNRQRGVVRQRWVKESGIPWHLNASRFQDLDRAYSREAQRLCLEWVRGFSIDKPGSSPSLMLFSKEAGVGKTTLLTCMASHIFEGWQGKPSRARCPVKFESGPGLVRRIRGTWDLPADGPRHEREEDVYNQLRGVPLLMLDDVGKEQPRSYRFTQEMYWFIVDERVKAGLPLVLNSRLPLTGKNSLEDLMGKDTVDRLYGMCKGEIVEIEAQSYRRQKGLA